MAVTSLMFWLQQHNSSLRCKNSSLRYNGSKFVADYAELKLLDCDATDWQTLPIESLWSLWPTVQLSSWDTRSTGITRFTALFPGPPEWAGVRRELLDFLVQGEINRGRHTDHPDGHHSVRTNQCPPPPSPPFLQAGCPSCRPTNSVKALKATSAFGLGRRRYSSPRRCYLHHLCTLWLLLQTAVYIGHDPVARLNM